jgi:TolA-binding protein
MTLPPSRRLAAFVEPTVDDARIDRAWAAVARQPSALPRPYLGPILVGGIALGVAIVAIVVVARGRAAGPSLAGVVFEAGSSERVTLPDGTAASLGTGARLRIDRLQRERAEVTVEKGEVRLDVRHDDARLFVVHAPKVDVVDRGTRFVVDVDGAAVRVSVETGRVEIVRADSSQVVISLSGGQSWSDGSVQTSATASAPPARVTTAAEDVRTTAVVPPAVSTASAGPSARELFQAANSARLDGRPRDAASAFDTIRRRFRDDPRAGLAAFELGRLRLDALGDPTGAAEALSDCIVLAPTASFREDADARLVEAFDRMHDRGRCAAARSAYLARYPGGVHATAVASRCP